MNKRKITILMFSIIVTFMLVLVPNKVKAGTQISNIYFGINEYRSGTNPNNLAYAIKNPYANSTSVDAGHKIWEIRKYNSNSDTTGTAGNYYCIRANVGIGSSDNIKMGTYDMEYVFTDEDDAKTNSLVKNDIINKKNTKNQKSNYYNLLALTDLFYVPGISTSNERKKLLEDAGIYEEDYNYQITDSDIQAVQQAAIWYFTESDNTAVFDNYDTSFTSGGDLVKSSWLWYSDTELSKNAQLYRYKTFSDYGLAYNANGKKYGPGMDRQEQATWLYNYLIYTALNNAGDYESGTVTSKYKITMYSNGGNVNNTQPVILIEKKPEVIKEFDLALRKYITKVNNQNVANTRVPNIDVSTIASQGTATYKHRKDPVTVKTGNTVTYNLTIYNEGEKAGRATKVVDQLPTGLKFNSVVSGNFEKSSYNESTNRLELTRKSGNNTNLAAYTTNNLKSETIEILCEVTATANTQNDKILTNIAWIAEAKDENNNIVVQDRNNTESKPSVNPDANKDNMSNYIGTSGNSTLNNSNYYYKGQEDDDDFEKLIILAVPQENSYNIVLVKEDSEGEQLNSTATFEVNGQTKRVTGRLTIAENIAINSSNVNTTDRYTVKETVAPDEYCPFDGTINISVTKKLENGAYKVNQVNYTVTDSNGTDITQSSREKTNVYLNENGNIYVEVKNYQFDLKLVKRIVEINGETVPERLLNVNVEKLANKTDTTAEYSLDKNPVAVKKGDIVKYTLRVYNEGEIDGYASEITEDIPEGLELLWSEKEGAELTADASLSDAEKEAIRYNQGIWTFDNIENGKVKTVTTDYLAKGKGAEIRTTGANLIKAFDKTKGYKNTINEKNPDYKEVSVFMKVVAENSNRSIIRNEAAITEDTDKDGKPIDDRDSDTEDWVKYEDDEDYDQIKLQSFDLALRKFIIAVSNDTSIEESEYLKKADGTYSRAPIVDTSKLDTFGNNNEYITTATYNHSKVPVSVNKNDYVVYMLRVYNEADISGYATEITDYLPPYLRYVDNEFNNQYGWTVSNDGRKVTTTYLSSQLINKTTTSNGRIVLSYREVPIMCQVTDDATGKITNIAEITESKDEDKQPVEDRDSETKNVVLPSDSNLPTYKDDESGDYIPGQQDDDDFEKVVVKEPEAEYFDLALRKFIIATSESIEEKDFNYLKNADGKYTREPVVDTSELNTTDASGNVITTSIYNHSKVPVQVEYKDTIIYMLRVYNEGNVDGYATEITDYLAPYLTYVESEFNNKYGWTVSNDGKKVTTKYLQDTLIKAAEKTANGYDLYYAEVPIMCQLTDEAKGKITNIAEITESKDGNKQAVTDRDSETKNVVLPSDNDFPSYKDNENGEYIPGQQDDDDFEKVILREKGFDLALRKFITKIDDEEIKTRIPTVKYDKDTNKITYEHTKDPIEVATGNIVTYTIRVYNEGDIAGYASEITDDIPDGLEFLPENSTNKEYRWVMYDKDGKETTDVSKAVKITTDYLSMEQEEARQEKSGSIVNDALLIEFDRNGEISDGNPHYADVKVAFKVTEPNSSERILVNSAQISDDTDSDGNPVDDIDSIPDEWNDGEDDQDREYVKLVEFDLALRKWVTHAIVIENGKETVTQTGHKAEDNPEQVVKVELNRKKLTSLQVKFKYSIRVTNEGNIAGYAKKVTDYIPQGLKFVATDNPDWKDEGNNVISTRKLENTLLQPGQSAEVQVTLTWITGTNNLGLKTNIAEISEDYNDWGAPDKDSTPNNKKDGEDDIDDAPVLLSISTGKAKIYLTLGLVVLITIAGGVAGIKKFVL